MLYKNRKSQSESRRTSRGILFDIESHRMKHTDPGPGYTAQVLIVEDDHELTDLLKDILGQLDHRYFTANTLTGARELLKSEKIDVMLLDLYLPDGTGIDLLSDLRQSNSPPPPTIVMTAFGNWETHLKAYRLGAFYYLDKPFRVTQLKVLVHQALTGKA